MDEWGEKGANSGLLLYKGGTICPERFYDNAAIAICSLLGYENEKEMSYWRSPDKHGMYERTLEYLYCSDDKWSSCTVSATRECYASDDVYLQCKQGETHLVFMNSSSRVGSKIVLTRGSVHVIFSSVYYSHVSE